MSLDVSVPLQQVLDLVGELCSNCQHKVRARIASGQAVNHGSAIPVALQTIVQDEVLQCGVSWEALRAKGNHAQIVNIRRKISIRARAAGFSFPQIGAALNRHHTAIMNLVAPKSGKKKVAAR